MVLAALIAVTSPLTLAARTNSSTPCQPGHFTFPTITGATLLDIAAQPIQNYSKYALLPGSDVGGKYTIDACNVTVTYGHVGWNDTINVSVWLPAHGWNSRLLGIGGGGYSGTFGSIYQTAAVGQDFVAIGTDAGHVAGLETSSDPSSWALSATGNPNYFLIEDFGSRSLGELSIIGKHITEEYYGQKPHASYFTGCSGGGRQAFALAQRYPNAFDGLLASSPAIYLGTAIASAYFAAQEMNVNKYYPSPCEVKAFTSAAIEACDKLDGVEDGIISDPSYCKFSAYDVVGQSYTCNGTEYDFTNEGARIIEAAWTGPKESDGLRYPYNKDADLTLAIITTACDSLMKNCTRVPSTSVASGGLSGSGGSTSASSDLLGVWFQNFLTKDLDFDIKSMTLEDYYAFLHQSSQEWTTMLGAADPNLDSFQAAGGKFISWHGMADTVLTPSRTSAYYEQVEKRNNRTRDFYRHFEAPGVGHCYGGAGSLPNFALQSLMDWVENGTVPDTLLASSAYTGLERPLCPYPLKQVYTGGNANVTSSFACV